MNWSVLELVFDLSGGGMKVVNESGIRVSTKWNGWTVPRLEELLPYVALIAAIVSGGVAYLVARHQAKAAARREMHERQSEMALDITKLLLDPAKAAAAARRFAVAVLKIVETPDDKQEGLVLFIPLNSRVTIGRDGDNDVVLNYVDVSRFHCGLVSEGKKVFLEDFDSKNGVCVNGKPLPGGSSQLLNDGDTLQICDCKLRFRTVHRSGVLTR